MQTVQMLGGLHVFSFVAKPRYDCRPFGTKSPFRLLNRKGLFNMIQN